MAIRIAAFVAALILTCAPISGTRAAEPYNWGGPYLGVDVGGAWDSQGVSATGPTLIPTSFNGSLNSSRIVGGIFGGYNWNVAPQWIVGGEADFDGTTIKDSAQAPNAGILPGGVSWTRSVSWLASLRARIGYTVEPDVLLYATAGGALTKENFSATNQIITGCPACSVTNFSALKSGFVIGAGLDWAVTPNVIVRAQYLYYEFPGATNTAPVQFAPALSSSFTWNTLGLHTARAGVAYKF